MFFKGCLTTVYIVGYGTIPVFAPCYVFVCTSGATGDRSSLFFLEGVFIWLFRTRDWYTITRRSRNETEYSSIGQPHSRSQRRRQHYYHTCRIFPFSRKPATTTAALSLPTLSLKKISHMNHHPPTPCPLPSLPRRCQLLVTCATAPTHPNKKQQQQKQQ